VRVCKPVATGAIASHGHLVSEDTLLLAEAAGQADLAAVTPWPFLEPAAPSVAAQLHGVTLKVAQLAIAVRGCVSPGSVLLVEGIGGLLCPLSDRETVADLVKSLGLPLVVVARSALGTLNHTLLTLEVARGRGLVVAGVVVSETTPVQGVAEENNAHEMGRLGVPVLAVMPYGGEPSALDQVDWWQLAGN